MAVKPRRKAVVVDVGGVKVGGTHPIVVQSMTNTDTADVASTVNQVMALARAGSELVRVTVNTEAAAAAVPRIVDACAAFGVPVITLFGPTRISLSENYHPRAIHMQHDLDCVPCQQRICPLGHHRCMRDLSIDEVYRAVRRQLAPAARGNQAA